MYWMPKTRMGKISFWMTLIPFLLIYLNYWVVMILSNYGINLAVVWPGLLFIACVVVFGVLSFVSIVKNKDKSILLIISSILGLLGVVFILGELFLPH